MNPSTTSQHVAELATLDSFEKGKHFEQYVIQLFNTDNFKVEEHRMSRLLEDNVLLQDCCNPDLELIFTKRSSHRFAVECKWRRQFIDGKIEWAKRHQIYAYQQFERQRRMPVFIVIGIGGEPSKPERLFVTPLRNIEQFPEVCEADLIPYKRRPASKFFFDTVQLKLF